MLPACAGSPVNPGLKASLNGLAIGEGPYAMFFGLNLVGHCVCLVGCLIGFAIHQFIWKMEATDGEATTEDASSGARIAKPGYEEQAKNAVTTTVELSVA